MSRNRYLLDDEGGLSLENRFTARLYSGLELPEKWEAAKYITYWLGHPDLKDWKGRPQSEHEFGKKIDNFKYLFRLGKPSECLSLGTLEYLTKRTRRDALLLYDTEGKIMGHAAYQMHFGGTQLHMFQIAVREEYGSRRVRLALQLLKGLIKLSRENDVPITRFGAGANPVMDTLNNFLGGRKRQKKLGIKYLGEGYFHILKNTNPT